MWHNPPSSAPIEGWHLFSIFLTTIVALITSVAPMPQVCLTSLVLIAFTGILDPNDSKKALAYALSGFSNPTVWLPTGAFFLSTAIIKSGLAKRLAFIFLKNFGKSIIGIAYSIYFGNFILSPIIPAVAAKSGGIFFPIINSIVDTLDSQTKIDIKRTKQYLNQIGAQAGIVTGSAFLTATSFNPLLANMAMNQGVDLSFSSWFIIIGPIALIICALSPLYNYYLLKPEIKRSVEIPKIAKEELKKKVNKEEKILLVILTITILGLIFGKQLNIYPTTLILTAIITILGTQILTWKDILETKGAWNLLIWFASLMMMVNYLGELGMIEWFNQIISDKLSVLNWSPSIYYISLTIIYYLMHYVFASNVAQALALYQSFLIIGISMGVPNVMMASSLAISSVLYGTLTHYSSGSGAIYFGSGHFTVYEWCRIGFFTMLFHLTIILTIGSMWWSLFI